MRRGVVVLLVGALLPCLVPSVAAAVEEYKGTGPSKSTIEAIEREAQKAAREQQEENERVAAKQHQEAAERETKAAEEQRLAQERQQREESESVVKAPCLVPALKGDSLKRATAALEHGKCRLGKVTRPHGHGTASVVISQTLKPGEHRAPGTAVGVTLGHPKR